MGLYNPLELRRLNPFGPYPRPDYLEHRPPSPLTNTQMQPSVGLLLTLGLSLCLTVNAGPHVRRDEVSLQNGNDAISLKYALHSPLFATSESIVTNHPSPTVPSSKPSVHCLPAEPTRWLVSTMTMLTVSRVASCSHRVPEIWCTFFPIIRTARAMFTVVQVSSSTQYGFFRGHNRLYNQERKYGGCCRKGTKT